SPSPVERVGVRCIIHLSISPVSSPFGGGREGVGGRERMAGQTPPLQVDIVATPFKAWIKSLREKTLVEKGFG
ncbi:hypothetical protein, partial [Dysgonomonas sp. 521]|uniref:hypothetical protein n=1 Tax=Dysgonomonas sp. 521 TaxID=2302932 RepID=UPI001C872961